MLDLRYDPVFTKWTVNILKVASVLRELDFTVLLFIHTPFKAEKYSLCIGNSRRKNRIVLIFRKYRVFILVSSWPSRNLRVFMGYKYYWFMIHSQICSIIETLILCRSNTSDHTQHALRQRLIHTRDLSRCVNVTPACTYTHLTPCHLHREERNQPQRKIHVRCDD